MQKGVCEQRTKNVNSNIKEKENSEIWALYQSFT